MDVAKSIITGKSGQITVFSVNTRLDRASDPDLAENVIGEILVGNTNLIVDLGDCPVADSAGLQALVIAFKKFRDYGGRMVLCRPNSRIMRVLETTRLSAVIETYPDLQTAISSFAPKT
ncbi:MAG: STAS domain-containing protein [Candidatus Saccharibacteria bacterium]